MIKVIQFKCSSCDRSLEAKPQVAGKIAELSPHRYSAGLEPGGGKKARNTDNCPKCGGSNYRRVKPKTLVAFTYDRLCVRCGFRCSPSTPRWASVVFIISGLFLFLPIVYFGLGIFLIAKNGDEIRSFIRMFQVFLLLCILPASLSLGFGIRNVFKVDKDNKAVTENV